MALKVYGIPGRTQAIVQIPVGKAFLTVEFRRGRQGYGTANRPALYSTRNETEQEMIENSPLFGRTIKLVRVEKVEAPVAAPVQKPAAPRKPAAPKKPAPEEPAPGEPEEAAPAAELAVEEHPEVTTKEAAVALLKSKGAKATDLTDEKYLKYAAKIGVSFPNLEQ